MNSNSSAVAVNPEFRLTTRLASLVGGMARKAGKKAVALDLGSLAATLDCARDTLRKTTMKLRKSSYLFQGYGCLMFIRYKAHPKAPCGVPQLYVINRHSAHTIGGEPPRVRWHLRQKSVECWQAYIDRLKNLAFAMIFRERGAANGTHKAIGHTQAEKNLRGPPKIETRWRVFGEIAGQLASEFSKRHPAASIQLQGWSTKRFAEGHSFARQLECLSHAVAQLERRRRDPEHLFPMPENPASWICEVARRHLEYDGLTPFIRFREMGKRKKRHGAGAPAIKVERQDVSKLAQWDAKRESLRERKTLPNGRQIEYDPTTGNWNDLP